MALTGHSFESARRAHPLSPLIESLLNLDTDAATHPHRTALAMEFLIQQGRIADVCRLVPPLARKFAEDAYFSTLTHFVRGLPEINDASTGFIDDPRIDLQHVMHPQPQATLLAFCGASHRLGMPLGLFHAWLQPLRVNVIYLRDFRQRFYLDGVSSVPGGFNALIERLKAMPSLDCDLPLLCLGSSRGAYGAISSATALNAAAVLCFAGPTHLGAQFLRDHGITANYAELYAWRPELASDTATDLRQRWLAYQRQCHACALRIIYGEHNMDDAAQAANLAGLPGVTLSALSGCAEHNIALALCEQERLGAELADWLNAGLLMSRMNTPAH